MLNTPPTPRKSLGLLAVCLTLLAAVMFMSPAPVLAEGESSDQKSGETHERWEDADRVRVSFWGKDGDGEDDDDEEDYDDDEDWDEEEEHLEWFLAEIEVYESLMELVFTMTEVASKEETAAVAAIMAVEEHAEGPEEIAEFFTGVLPEVTNPVVERAIRLQLIDTYAELEDREKVIEQLRALIVTPAK